MRAADVKAGGFDLIKEFQRRWSQIGFVPIKEKDALQKEYKSVVDGMFSVLRSSERDRSMNRFKERVQNMKSGQQLRSEREKLFNKVRQMEQDIATLENNINLSENALRKFKELLTFRCQFHAVLCAVKYRNTKIGFKFFYGATDIRCRN